MIGVFHCCHLLGYNCAQYRSGRDTENIRTSEFVTYQRKQGPIDYLRRLLTGQCTESPVEVKWLKNIDLIVLINKYFIVLTIL